MQDVDVGGILHGHKLLEKVGRGHYGEVWRAVMADFFERHRLGGIRISINDAGATPAIVALRLDQAIEEYTRSRRT